MLRDPDRAARAVEAVRPRVAVPVTVKIRAGWDDARAERRRRPRARGGGRRGHRRARPDPGAAVRRPDGPRGDPRGEGGGVASR